MVLNNFESRVIYDKEPTAETLQRIRLRIFQEVAPGAFVVQSVSQKSPGFLREAFYRSQPSQKTDPIKGSKSFIPSKTDSIFQERLCTSGLGQKNPITTYVRSWNSFLKCSETSSDSLNFILNSLHLFRLLADDLKPFL